MSKNMIITVMFIGVMVLMILGVQIYLPYKAKEEKTVDYNSCVYACDNLIDVFDPSIDEGFNNKFQNSTLREQATKDKNDCYKTCVSKYK